MTRSKTPRQMLNGLFIAEIWRLGVVGVLFWAIFSFTTALPLYVLSAFVIGLIAQSAACFQTGVNES